MNIYILFTTRVCSTCLKSKQLAQELIGMKPGLISICDAFEHPATAKYYDIKTVPTLIHDNGKLKSSWSHGKCEAKLRELIMEVK